MSILDWIYPISYLISLTGLVLWFLTQANKKISSKMSALFLLGYLTYLAALAFSSGLLPYKLLILVRDMAVMGAVVYLFNVTSRRPLATVGLAVVAAGVVYLSYFKTLDLTFPQIQVKQLASEQEFLVQIHKGEQELLDRLHAKFPCSVQRAFRPADIGQTELDNYYIVNVESHHPRVIKSVYDWLIDQRNVSWVELNEVLSLSLPDIQEADISEMKSTVLNDPMISRQWGFGPMGANDLHQGILGSGVKSVRPVKVAILDTGVDAKHEDLQGNFISTNKVHDTDPRGHGTHCAGIAAAVSNNQIGIASLAPGPGYVQITSIRVMDASGVGTQQQVIDAMIQAVDQGAGVLSLSLGGISTISKQKAYQEAVEYATKHNTIVVVAAGNSKSNAKNYSPANVKGVIAVSAVDASNTKATFSNSVADIKMALAAPGVNIFSTLPDNKYGNLSGTSMATPCVAGMIGLMKSFRPDLTAREAYTILNETGVTTKSGKQTGKLIQPAKAIESVLD